MDRRMAANHRHGFSLIELLVVISIMIVLTVMTIGAIDLGITSEQVRGGARTVQSALEGSRDRAIYAKEPRGIRFLVNETVTEALGTEDVPTLATTLVYIGSPGAYTSLEDRQDVDRDGNRDEPAPPVPGSSKGGPFVHVVRVDASPTDIHMYLIGTGTRWNALYEQGLIGGGTKITIHPDSLGAAEQSTEVLTLHPSSFDNGVLTEADYFGGITPGGDLNGNDGGGPGEDEVVRLTYMSQRANRHLDYQPDILPDPWHFTMETSADILQGEEPIGLPRNCCIDLEMSHLPSDWLSTLPDGSKQFSNRMDLLFSPNGGIIGKPGAAGLIHLRVCDIGDAIANTIPGSPTKPSGEPRDGDEFGVTIFTRSGRVIVHPLDVTDDATYPPTWEPSTSYAVGDRVSPPVYNGVLYECINAGSSGSNEPRWNTAPGGITFDPVVPLPGERRWVGIKHDPWELGVDGSLAK